MKLIKKETLSAVAPYREPGYLQAVLEVAADKGAYVEISDEAFQKVRERFSAPPLAVEQIRRLGGDLMQWGKLGFPVTPPAEYEARMRICRTCPEWTGARCLACGCVGIKQHLASSRCPRELW